uniref:Uncharacterized protein n=1 Tax=Arundo donax TaxID=35708 RepID=A0A0A8Y4Y3_ARUDO
MTLKSDCSIIPFVATGH